MCMVTYVTKEQRTELPRSVKQVFYLHRSYGGKDRKLYLSNSHLKSNGINILLICGNAEQSN